MFKIIKDLIEGIMELLQSTSTHLLVVCLAIYAIARLGFQAYENTFQKEGVSEKCQTMKIHLLYIAGILLFIIIEIASYLAIKSDPSGQSLMQYISFASTLASIILSILAIILTIVTTSKGDSNLAKMELASKTLGDVIKEFEDFKNIKTEVFQFINHSQSLDKKLDSAIEKINNAISEIKDTTQKGVTEITEHVKKINEYVFNFSRNPSSSSQQQNLFKNKKGVEKFLSHNSSLMGLLGIYSCLQADENKLNKINISDIYDHDIFGPNLSSDAKSGYIIGYCSSFSKLGLITVDVDIYEMEMSVSSVSPHMLKASELYTLMERKTTDDPDITDMLKHVKDYFESKAKTNQQE